MALLCFCIVTVNCQNESFDFQPGYDYDAAHFNFKVETPSKADILFVIDDSGSMREEQANLRASISKMLYELASKDTDYRVGVTSNDMIEDFKYVTCDSNTDCAPLGKAWSCSQTCLGHKGERRCVERVTIELDGGTDIDLCVNLNHDGKKGRLIAVNGNGHVLDRNDIARKVGAANAEREVLKQLSENMFGLGIYSPGYEQGLNAAAAAIGVDPDDVIDPINPANDLTRAPDGPNTYKSYGADGPTSWVRPDAMLAIIFLSDEEDCSYPANLKEIFLGDVTLGYPASTSCYLYKDSLRPVSDFTDLFIHKKADNSLTGAKKEESGKSRLTYGFIGGMSPATEFSDVPGIWTQGVPSDCRRSASGPIGECACFAFQYDPLSEGMCSFTTFNKVDLNGGDVAKFSCLDNCCEAMAGDRYFSFVSSIKRHIGDSICQDDYSRALAEIATIATEPCFQLRVYPACSDATQVSRFIKVLHFNDVLPMVDPEKPENADAKGWFYRSETNEICLHNMDRLIDDEYDITVMHTNDNGRDKGCI